MLLLFAVVRIALMLSVQTGDKNVGVDPCQAVGASHVMPMLALHRWMMMSPYHVGPTLTRSILSILLVTCKGLWMFY